MSSFIGNQPATSFETVRKQVSTSNSGTTITLDYPVTSVADIRLTINAVVQSYDNYSVSGSTLTVGGTLNNDRVEILFVGRTYGSIAPTDASVGLNQLSATGTPSSSNFLRGDNAWATPSGTTINNNADNRIITGSGTANTLEGESTLTYDGTTLQPTTSGGGLKLDNLGSSDVNTLDDYEEGSWTPNWDVNGGSVTGSSSVSGKYIKIGKCVMLQAQGTLTTSSPTGYYKFTNAPFQADGNFTGTGHEFGQTGTQQIVWMDDNSTQVNIKKYDGSVIANPYLRLNIFYHTD